MERSWIAYVATGLLAVAAGVAIAGLPSGGDDDLAITAPPTTRPTPATTDPTTATAPTTTDVASTTAVPTTTAPAGTTTSTVPPLVDRDELRVTVANGTDVSGVAGAVATELEQLGYVDVGRGDTTPAPVSVVFHVAGLEAEAARLAADLDLDATSVVDAVAAPNVSPPFQGQLLAVIGLDRVDP